MDVANKALWEQEVLTEVRRGTGRRQGEAGGRVSNRQCSARERQTPWQGSCELFWAAFSVFLMANS